MTKKDSELIAIDYKWGRVYIRPKLELLANSYMIRDNNIWVSLDLYWRLRNKDYDEMKNLWRNANEVNPA